MNEPSQRLGKGMLIAAWIGVLGLLTLFFDHLLEKQHNPNQSLTTQYHQDGTRQVILQRNRSGHYITSGTVNEKPVVFLLDTGATMVSIPGHLAHYLDLRKGTPLLANTANGVVTTYSTELDSVALDDIRLYQVRASINPTMQGDEILLGMSFLKQLEFTQRGDTLIIRQYP